MNFKKLVLALALAIPFTAGAEDISYSYLEAGATRIDPDHGDSENGFGFGGAGAITENWHVVGNYRSYEVAGVGGEADLAAWNVGFGYNMGISDSADLFGRATYEKIDSDIANDDGNGFGLEVGIRNAFSEHFEGGASLKYVDIENENDTGVELYGQYKFGEWGIVGKLNFSDAGNELFIGPRISF